MVTSKRLNAASPAPHQRRDLAESFGVDPERYDRVRPSYPQELADRVIAELAGRRVLDVGIGTGLSAEPFCAAGCQVLGVEADPRMADFARGRGYDVEVSAFEEWDPAGRSFDAVISGQAWHWIDPRAGALQAARVLAPRALLVLFWNSFRLPPEIVAALSGGGAPVREAVPFRSSSAGVHEDSRDRAEQGIRATGCFAEPVRWQLDRQRRYSRDEWIDGIATGAGAAQLPSDKLEDVRERVGAAIDGIGGSFTMTISTIVLEARLLARSS